MIPDTAIRNDDGQVAMRYGKQANSYVKCGQNEYIFVVRANIAMAWVNEEDVECMLGVRGGGCCPSKKKQVINFIDETHFRRWTNGGGR